MPVIKRPLKQAAAPEALSPVEPSASQSAGGNPIFGSDPAIHREAKRQLGLIDQELQTPRKDGKGQHNLLHILRGILEADRLNLVISTASREQFLGADDATIPQTEQLLRELESLGYLEVATRRQKNHDYRPTQKARDTWSSVQLWEDISPMKQSHYRADFSEEHYLVPFDAGIYLDRVPSRDPQDLPVGIKGFHLLPCGAGTIAIACESEYASRQTRTVVKLLDLREQEPTRDDYRTRYLERLSRYIGFPNLVEELETLLSQADNRRIPVVPRYAVRSGPLDHPFIILQDTEGRHHQVPEAFLLYLYNNYFGEDLELQVSLKPTATESSPYYHSNRPTQDTFLLVVLRRGSERPLLIQRFKEVQATLATIP